MNRPLHRFSVLSIAAILLAAASTQSTSTPSHSASADAPAAKSHADRWGIREIHPTRPGGHVWYADWNDHKRDRWETWVQTGATHQVDAENAVLEVGGHAVRLYVLDPRERQQWTGALEVTVYARRVPGAGVGDPWSGIVTDVRTNHGSTEELDENSCDSRGLLARLRFDGQADFGKEVRHPNTISRNAKQVWEHGLPAGKWIGYKHIVYDTERAVVQELWVDFPGRGHHWTRVNRVRDRGGSWGRGEQACASGVDPALPLRGGADRAGSESGLPNVSVLFRVDEISSEGGLEYRWASVREVTAP